jgi:serine/threonine-protein kinase RsbW
MSRTMFTKNIKSTTKDIAETLTEALNVLCTNGWCSADNNFCIRLCLEEALVNAVVHGNENQSERQVVISIEEEGDHCFIKIKDEGTGFNPENVLMPECSSLGGRGVCLIKEFMDEVIFNESEKCFVMKFGRDTFSQAMA